jgi:rhodanese-related sulfurtransferase
MRNALMTVAALAVLVPSLALACDDHKKSAQSAVKKVTVAEVLQLQKDNKAKVFDANGEKTRAKHGFVPGAVLLTSSSKYDVAKELPATKDSGLVFYCANAKCSASEAAARRAMEAGFTNVAVMPDGIMGWKDAGQRTEMPQS